MLKLGVIGYGDAAGDFIEAAAAHPAWKPVAAGGRNQEKAAAFAKKFSITPMAVADMAAQPGIDVIAVATPPGVHLAGAVTAAENGKHLIVEKPLALNMKDCTAITEAAERNSVQLMCSQSLQFYPGAIAARTQVDAGAIGDTVNAVITSDCNYFSDKRSGWQLDAALSGGGVVMNPMIHFTDQVRFLTGGKVIAVSAVTGSRKPGFMIEGDATVLYRMDNGKSAIVTINGYQNGYRNTCRVTGTSGTIDAGLHDSYCTLRTGGDPVTVPGPKQEKRNGTECNTAYYNHLEYMRRTIMDGEPMKSDGRNGAENVRINLAILKSAATGKELTL